MWRKVAEYSCPHLVIPEAERIKQEPEPHPLVMDFLHRPRLPQSRPTSPSAMHLFRF